MAVMVANWNKVVDSLEQVQLAVPRLEYSMETMTQESEACIEGIDAKIMMVRAQVGKPPENFEGVPAPDLWNSAIHFESNLQDLRATLAGMHAGLKDVRSQIELQKRASVDASLLKQQVEQAHAFMGKVYNEVLFTQQEMLKMQQTSHSFGDAALGATLSALEARTSALERSDVTSGSMMNLVKETVERLGLMEVETGNLKSSIGGDVVKIGSRAFHSSGEVEIWLDELGGDGDWADVFFDFISMLETCLDVSRTSDEHFAREGAAHKGGYESLMSGRVLSSFSTTVPAVFNKITGGPFSRIQTFKDWDSEDEREGLVPDVNRRLLQWTEQHQKRIDKRLGNHPQARELADRMLFDSTKFWNDLVTFIAQYYRRLTANDEAMSLSEVQNQAERRAVEAAIKQSRQEAWELMLKILDDLLQEMSIRRADGKSVQDKGTNPRERTALVIYASLRAHKFMKELKRRGFEKHACLTPTFNSFLFMNRASVSSVKRVADRVETIAAQAGALQSPLDQAGNGGGGGGRNGGRGGGKGGRGGRGGEGDLDPPKE